MGVTGCGKTTVGMRLAAAMNAAFKDADDLHAADAVAQMAAGVPLTDDDRWPWLARVGEWLAGRDDAVIACSALRRVYRDRIRDLAGNDVVFIHLAAAQSVLEPRVRQRAHAEGHFAGPGLLDSQYATLEPLEDDEAGSTVPIENYDLDGVVLAARAIAEASAR